jgi:hypothetical protein
MRTTIALDPDVEAAVVRLRRQEGLGLSEAVNTLARRGMVPSQREAPYEFNPRPLHALIDLTNISDVLETIEEDGGE